MIAISVPVPAERPGWRLELSLVVTAAGLALACLAWRAAERVVGARPEPR